jgi:hypothetical protein
VLVVDRSEPETDGFETEVVDAPFAPAGPLRLVEDDMVFAGGCLDAGNVVGGVDEYATPKNPSLKTYEPPRE